MPSRAKYAGLLAVFALALTPRAAAADPGQDARSAAAASAAERLVVAMDASSEHVRRLLRAARQQRSARRIACFDEALSRVDVALRVGREEAKNARLAARDANAEEAEQHLVRVVRLREVARSAASGGEMCAAGPEFQAYEGTTVRVIVDPKIAPDTT